MFWLGVALGGLLQWVWFRFRTGGAHQLATELLHEAEIECSRKKNDLALFIQKQEFQQKELSLRYEEEWKQKIKKSERLSQELQQQKIYHQTLAKRMEECKNGLEERESKYQQKEQELLRQLEAISNLSKEEAKEACLLVISKELGHFALQEKERLQKEVHQYTLQLVLDSLYRLPHQELVEPLLTTVPLPSQEIKGRIIGREGRNIRFLEQCTGVQYLFDETPQSILLSSPDPLRREVARLTLLQLIRDGRIHISRIEEAVRKAKLQLEQCIRQKGSESAAAVGIYDLSPAMIEALGRLHFLYYQGQNLLQHSMEMAFLCGTLAAELKLHTEKAKRMGLLHDIGKATVGHGDTHAAAGAQLALEAGEQADIVNAIASHHEEIQAHTMEASLLCALNRLVHHRFGSRTEGVEQFLRRMEKLEDLCTSFEEVEHAYVLQAGREISVFVKPDRVTDESAQILARTIVKKLEKEMSFIGNIQVTVIRETKAIDFAS